MYWWQTYFFVVLKDNIQKVTSIEHTSEEKLMAITSIDDDYVENITNVQSSQDTLGIIS